MPTWSEIQAGFLSSAAEIRAANEAKATARRELEAARSDLRRAAEQEAEASQALERWLSAARQKALSDDR